MQPGSAPQGTDERQGSRARPSAPAPARAQRDRRACRDPSVGGRGRGSCPSKRAPGRRAEKAGRCSAGAIRSRSSTPRTPRIPELVPIRWGRMFGVAVRLLPRRLRPRWRSISRTRPRRGCRFKRAATPTRMNFGIFATPERNLIVDLNDFDETPRALGMGREATGRRSRRRRARDRVDPRTATRRPRPRRRRSPHREHMRGAGAPRPALHLLRARRGHDGREDDGPDPGDDRQERRRRSRAKCSEVVPKLTELVGDRMQIVTRPPVIQPLSTEASSTRCGASFRSTARSSARRSAHPRRALPVSWSTALKVVGVGSVGTRLLHRLARCRRFTVLPPDLARRSRRCSRLTWAAATSITRGAASSPASGSAAGRGRRVPGVGKPQDARVLRPAVPGHEGRSSISRRSTRRKPAASAAPPRGPHPGAGLHARGGDPAAIAAYLTGKVSDAFDVAAIAKSSRSRTRIRNEKD